MAWSPSPLFSFAEGLGINGGTTTGGYDTTGADFIWLPVVYYAGGVAPVVSDSKSNTYTPGTIYVANDLAIRAYYCANPTVGTGHNFTAPGLSSYSSIGGIGFSGSHASPFDQETGQASHALSLSSGVITPSGNGYLVLSAVGVDQVDGTENSFSEITGMTTAATVQDVSGQYLGLGLAWAIQGAAAGVQAVWYLNSGVAGDLSIAIQSFAPAVQPSVGHPTSRRWGGVPHMGGGHFGRTW